MDSGWHSVSADPVFVDTNVLVYVFDDSEPKKQALAHARLQGTRDVFISTQVLQELYVALTKGPDPIATSEIAEYAVRAATGYSIVHIDTALIMSAIVIGREHQLSFWDGLIVSAAARSNCQILLTEDLNAGQVISGVKIVNPFVEAK